MKFIFTLERTWFVSFVQVFRAFHIVIIIIQEMNKFENERAFAY